MIRELYPHLADLIAFSFAFYINLGGSNGSYVSLLTIHRDQSVMILPQSLNDSEYRCVQNCLCFTRRTADTPKSSTNICSRTLSLHGVGHGRGNVTIGAGKNL